MSKQGPKDANEAAFRIMQSATSETRDSENEAKKVAADGKRGHAGGKVGGVARAKKLSKEERSEIAKKAAQARWASES